jgi:hypothetical protein
MRAAKLGLVALAALAAAAALAAQAVQDKPAAPAAPEARPKSFIRMDLLNKPARELAPPKRGIFSPSAEDEGAEAAAADAGLSAAPSAGGGQPREGGRPSGAGRAEAAATASGLPSLSLRYIGFVKSPRAIIGLVVVQGQALAVGTGDIVADWYKIGAITPKEIEVTGPDGSKAAYPLEGEEE